MLRRMGAGHRVAEYDKYGRKTKKQSKSELREMYKLEQSAEDRLDYLNRLARGEIEESDSDSDAESDEEVRVKARSKIEGGEGEEEDEDSQAEYDEDDDSDYDSITSEDERNTISLLQINKVSVSNLPQQCLLV